MESATSVSYVCIVNPTMQSNAHLPAHFSKCSKTIVEIIGSVTSDSSLTYVRCIRLHNSQSVYGCDCCGAHVASLRREGSRITILCVATCICSCNAMQRDHANLTDTFDMDNYNELVAIMNGPHKKHFGL